jgi:hypothetical protein
MGGLIPPVFLLQEVFMLFLFFGYSTNILCALLFSILVIENRKLFPEKTNIPMKVIIVLSILFPFMFASILIITGIYIFARFIFENL